MRIEMLLQIKRCAEVVGVAMRDDHRLEHRGIEPELFWNPGINRVST